MRNKTLLLLLSFSLIISIHSCKKPEKESSDSREITLENFPKTISLKAQKPYVQYDSLSFWEFDVFDSLLVAYNARHPENGIFYFFNKSDFTLVKSYLKVGRGPKEIMRPGNVTFNKEKRLVYLSDGGRYSIFEFSIDSIFQNPQYFPEKSLTFFDQRTFMVAERGCKDNFFVQSGQNGNYLLSFVDFNGNIIKNIGKHFMEMGERPEFGFNQLMNHSFTIHPDGNRFFIHYYLFDRVVGINENGEQLFSIIGPHNISPKYDRMADKYVFNLTDKVKAYEGIYSDDKYVFVRYLGKPLFKRKEDGIERQYSNIIHVFDWKGNPVAKIELEKEIGHSFVIDNKQLIAFDPNSYNPWVVYDLSNCGLYE